LLLIEHFKENIIKNNKNEYKIFIVMPNTLIDQSIKTLMTYL
jgi:hypothetical protein